ncbi:MAG: hypothetical protein AABY95_01510 [Pseudomonadota bacterium]
MISIEQLIDEAKAKLGSYAAVARFLGVERSIISGVRSGRTLPPVHAAKLAELVGRDWKEGVVSAVTSRPKSEKEKMYWRSKLGQRGFILLFCLCVALLTDGNVDQPYLVMAVKPEYTMYAIIVLRHWHDLLRDFSVGCGARSKSLSYSEQRRSNYSCH